MKRVWSLMGVVAVILAPTVSWACSCIGPVPFEQAQNEADAVFEGEAMEFNVLRTWSRGQPGYIERRRAVFEVRKVWKGPREHSLVIETGIGGGDCGYDFVAGNFYVVYATTASDGTLHASLCSRTHPIGYEAPKIGRNSEEDREERKALGKPQWTATPSE